ncbi:MAG: CoA transferase [Candidatus Binatia bacterium]|nr:MAG: CoA transferase [Candidatus Binatia bacterium]
MISLTLVGTPNPYGDGFAGCGALLRRRSSQIKIGAFLDPFSLPAPLVCSRDRAACAEEVVIKLCLMTTGDRPKGLLAGVRVLECSLLGPAATGMHLADLGAEVIKVEAPGGDYVRKMAFPIINGISLLHWHLNRGKRSIVLDLRQAAAVDVFLRLVEKVDVVIEAMRPGALARRGITFERMCQHNPRIVYCTVSGYGMTGPYRDLPAHGIAFDAWAGVARPTTEAHGFPAIPSYTAIGMNAGPLYAAMGILAALLRSRATGQPCWLEVAQSDAAAAFNWNGIEGNKAYERPPSEVTGNDGDGRGERRPVGDNSMTDAVRYQFYRTKDGMILFMASEQQFWRNFAYGIGRPDLFEAHPGARYADHARGNLDLRRELADIFATRTTAEWVQFGLQVNTPIAPVHDTKTITRDPHFRERIGFWSRDRVGTELMPSPVRLVNEELPIPEAAAVEPGCDTERVLQELLDLTPERLSQLRAQGVFGGTFPGNELPGSSGGRE